MRTIDVTTDFCGETITLQVTGIWHQASRALPDEPPEPAHFEIDAVEWNEEELPLRMFTWDMLEYLSEQCCLHMAGVD